jgi:C4-dicarboxylate-specific signal transduction histidine kinase
MTRVLSFCLFALAILSGALYLLATNQRAETLASVDTTLAARAFLISHMVDHTLQWRLSEAFTFAALPSLRGYGASDDASRPSRTAAALVELKAIVAADPNIRAVSIVDPSGRVILSSDDSMNARWGDRVYVRQALAGQLYASPPSRDGGQVSQYYSAPIIDNAGSVAAGLVIRVSAQELWDSLGSQPEAMLVDEEGVRIIDRTGSPQTFSALVPLASDVAARVLLDKRYGVEVTQITATRLVNLADAIKGSKAASLSYQNVDGKTVRAATQQTLIYPWTVVVFEEEDFALTPMRDALIWTCAVSAISLIFGVIIGVEVLKRGRAS